jgi:hypothetical protein
MKQKTLFITILLCLFSFSFVFASISANIGGGGSVVETDTLQTVTDRGATTSNDVTINGKLNMGYTLNMADNRLVWQDHGGRAIQLTTADSFISTYSDLKFKIYDFSNYNEKMRLTQEGYFGIGTTDPQNELEVHGDAVITGTATIGTTTSDTVFNVTGQKLFGLTQPELSFDTTNGNFIAGMNAYATPSASFATAIAMGNNIFDTANTPQRSVEALGDYTFAIHGRARGESAIAIGSQSLADNTRAIAIGKLAKATNQYSIALGPETQATADYAVAIGLQSIAQAQSSFAIGIGSRAEAQNSFAFNGVARGANSGTVGGAATGDYSFALGEGSSTLGLRAVAIGENARAYGTDSIAIGARSYNGLPLSGGPFLGNNSITLGQYITNYGINTIMIGTGPTQVAGASGENTKNNTIVFYHTDTVLADMEYNKGVRIGATTGESITMDGDDLYVKDNTEIDGFLVLGSNTETGLGAGDINASTIYYDTLTAKSPIFLCSYHELKCFVIDTEAEKEYYVTIDKDYNIISSKNKESKKSVTVTKKVKDKFDKLKVKKQQKDAYIDFTKDCAGVVEKNQCVRYIKKDVFYKQAVESFEQPVFTQQANTCYRLNETLQTESYTCYSQIETGNTTTEYRFKEGCSWSQEGGYDCVTRQVLGVYR